MARFDAATEAFIAKVADTGHPRVDDLEHEKHPVKDALSIAKKVVSLGQSPGKTISRALIGTATKEMLKEGSIPVLRLYGLLNDHYGTEWHDWEPETIWDTLAREQGITLDRELKDMVLALQLTVNTNGPFEHWHVFEKVGHAFNENIVDFQILQPLELDEAAFTLAVLGRIRKAIDVEDEVCGYIAAVAKESGVVYLPPELFPERCQQRLDSLYNNELLRDAVKKLWHKKPKSTDSLEEVLSLQLGILEDIRDYVSDKMAEIA